MNRSQIYLVPAYLTLLTACATGPAKQPATAVQVPKTPQQQASKPGAPEGTYLVWLVSTKNEPARSYLVSSSSDGTCAIESQADGVWLTAGGQLWRWEEHEREVPWPKQFAAAEDGGSTVGWAELSSVVSPDKKRLEWPEDMKVAKQVGRDLKVDMPGQVDSSVDLQGSVGPWAIITHSAYVFEGGAHGYSEAVMRVLDLRTGSKVESNVLLPDGAAWKDIKLKARSELEKDESAKEEDSTEPKWNGVLPVYGKDGVLDIGYVFSISVCHACAHGPWAATDTLSVRIKGQLAASLEEFGEPPRCIASFAAAHPETEIGGWNKMDQKKVAPNALDKWFSKKRVPLSQ